MHSPADKAKIVLKSGKDQSLRRRHPWVFSGAIKKIYGTPVEGDLVEVFDNKDEKLGEGHYQDGSIAVRMLTFGSSSVSEKLLEERIKAAWEHRKQEGLFRGKENDVFRLVNAEGDQLPGLIVDYYGGAAVIQLHSIGMYRNIEQIAERIRSLKDLPVDTVFLKSKNTLPEKAGIKPVDELLSGDRTNGTVLENGYRFRVDWEGGQKTGFFIDQRENRKLVARYSAGKDVLNMFCFSGGFSVYALGGGANMVHSVDSSGPAIDLARENMSLNFPEARNHEEMVADAFTYLVDMGSVYDLIILDPPAFAKHQRVLNNALQGYKRLNQKAIEKIRPGGILFTFSCSQAVSRENFRKSVFAAAANAGRHAQILHHLSQPPDHPVSLFHPEGEYLKGLVLKIE